MKTLVAILAATLLLSAAALVPSSPEQHPAMRPKQKTQKITTFLWFDNDAEDAIRFYCSIFPNSSILTQTSWGPGGPVPAGTLMSARFQLAGQEFLALNGGPMYRFTEAISLYVDCGSQAEIDEMWSKLTADGGEPGQCGWLKDRWGLSWQIIPSELGPMLGDKDPARAARVAHAMVGMRKLDISKLKAAYEGR